MSSTRGGWEPPAPNPEPPTLSERRIAVLAGVEQRAFAKHPDIQEVLAEALEETKSPPPTDAETTRSLARTLFLLVVVKLGPVWYGGSLIGHVRFTDWKDPNPVLVGVLVLSVAYLASLVPAWRDLRQKKEMGALNLELGFAAANGAFAGLSARLVLSIGGSVWLTAAAFVSAAACSVASVATAVWLARVSNEPQNVNPVSNTAFDRSRRAVEALTPVEQIAVERLLNKQIDALVARKRLDPDTAADAKRQRLGTLGRWAVMRELHARSQENRSQGRR